jgi:colanic acid biosynthesis glycosyl transferase WcaI
MENAPADRRTVLVVSQTFVPDPAAVGQHMSDVAFELARRGHSVRVNASGRGYEDPTAIYPAREVLHGAVIRRFPFASFGKKSIPLRVAGTAAFMIQAFFGALFTPRLAGIFFSTSPPLIGLPMCIAAMIRRVPTVYWAMDLNPDQLIALGKLRSGTLTAKLLEAVNRFILRHATRVVALDRFMADRLAARGISRDKILILPPWTPEDFQPPVGENAFRAAHGLTGKFVLMYSGNHSPSNPLKTILDAAVQLKDEANLKFLFVGGGSGKREVETYIRDHQLTSVLSLPYQPLTALSDSLSAADVHIVSLGENMVGIIHPCKIYGAMAVGRPVLFLGPQPSHIADLLTQYPIGIHVSHGDTAGAVAAIREFLQMSPEKLAQMGQLARSTQREHFGLELLRGRFCQEVERALGLNAGNAPKAG